MTSSGFLRRKKRESSKSIRKMLFAGRACRPCHYCGCSLTFEAATVDHVKPLSGGGYNRRRNAVIACVNCNHAKGAMSVDEFIATRSI